MSKRSNENTSSRLHQKVRARRDADQRRTEATQNRQSLYESRKKAKFSGKKVTFSDSEESESEPETQQKGLFDGSDYEVLSLDIDSKIRSEHEGSEGAKAPFSI